MKPHKVHPVRELPSSTMEKREPLSNPRLRALTLHLLLIAAVLLLVRALPGTLQIFVLVGSSRSLLAAPDLSESMERENEFGRGGEE